MTEEPRKSDVQHMAAAAFDGLDPADDGAAAGAVAQFHSALLETADRGFGPERAGRPCSRFLCQGCDALVRRVVALAERPAGAGATTRAAWVATGGYGSGLMSPGSSIRLVMLHQGQEGDEEAQAVARRVAGLLKDADVPAVCAARTVPEVVDRMKQDYVGTVSMLTTRMVLGSGGLYRQFRTAAVSRFLAECWGSFAEEVLREVLDRRDPFTGSPRCTEPNLKEGAGCLRDIGAIEKLNECLGEVPGLGRLLDAAGGGGGLLGREEARALREALDFIRRVRNRLHFCQQDGGDLLHRKVQDEVARSLGLEDGPDGAAATTLMRRLLGHTGRVARLVEVFNERFMHLHRVAWTGAEQPPRRDLGDGFVEVEGRIYSAVRPAFATEQDVPRMMRLFTLSQRRHLPISQELLDQVTDNLRSVNERSRAEAGAGEAFMDLLAGSVGVAERIAWMRDCGLLQAYLPEMAPLVHRINPDTRSELTLDEHAIQAVRIIDDLGHAKEPRELPQRQALEQVQRPDLLRLAILLHDLGEVSDRPVLQLVEALAERIGLRRRDRGQLVSLVRDRDVLWQQTEQGGPRGPESELDLAKAIGNPEGLRLLYLLTYAHARAMGTLGWFAWRDARLLATYQTTMSVLSPDYTPFATARHFERELAGLAARRNLAEQARQFVSLLPELYKAEVPPSEAVSHVEMLQRLAGQPAAMDCSLADQDARVWVCTSDVPARFAQIAGIFTYNGLDILGATAFTLSDGTVLDRFIVQGKGRPVNPDPRFWQKIENDLVLSIEGESDIAAALAEEIGSGPPGAAVSSRRLMTTVHFHNEPHLPFTALDVVARDRRGLLFAISGALGSMGLNIEFASINTRSGLAQDVFFLTDAETGQPVADEGRLAQVRGRLVEITA